MCSHYQAEKRRHFYEKRFGIKLPLDWEPPRGGGGLHVYPTHFAPIVRRPPERDSGDEAVPDFEVVEACFGLLPGFATEVKYGTRTYNARSETVASLASFKQAWTKARHCIVPCEAIYEPDWRTGTHIPTRFTAADGGTLGVAGLWQPWKSPEGAFRATVWSSLSEPLASASATRRRGVGKPRGSRRRGVRPWDALDRATVGGRVASDAAAAQHPARAFFARSQQLHRELGSEACELNENRAESATMPDEPALARHASHAATGVAAATHRLASCARSALRLPADPGGRS